MTPIDAEQRVLPPGLVAAWRADKPSSAEEQRRYQRFLRSRHGRSAVPRTLGWVAAGLLLGVGLAQAATLLPGRWFGAARGTAATSIAQPTVPTLAATAIATAAAATATPVTATPEPSAPAAVVARAAAPSSAPRPADTAERVSAQWRRAADALRANDFDTAQQALLEIERSASGGERDAARLARAQLLSRNGRDAEALALLSDLQANAQSAVVRDKARDLFGRLSEKSASDRSTEVPTDTNQP